MRHPSPRRDLPEFVLVTGNRGKLAEARRILGWRVASVPAELPEIQSLDLREVLIAKAAEAWSRLGRPLVVEETGLELAALNGFPGPLVKWMLEAVGAEGISRAAHALGDTRVVARCALLFRDRQRSVYAEGITEGDLVLPGRGDRGFGWDPVFRPRDEELTYGELPPAEKDRLGHRGRAWRSLAEKLQAER